MELIDNKGLTAIVDVMFFITLMTIVFSVTYSLQPADEGPEVQSAQEILDLLLESETCADMGDGPVRMKVYEGLVYSMYVNCGTDACAINILDSHFMREDSYCLKVEQGNKQSLLGLGRGTPVSACTRVVAAPLFTATYTLEVF